MVAKLLKKRRSRSVVFAAIDRALHPMRRKRALQALRVMRTPDRIVVMCRGNVCRSPVAASILQTTLGELGITVTSAGLSTFRGAIPNVAQSAATRNGHSLDGHTPHRATHLELGEASLVVVMEESHAQTVHDYYGIPNRQIILLGDCDPEPVDTRDIRDPMGSSDDAFDECY